MTKKHQVSQTTENSDLLFSRMVKIYAFVEILIWAAVTISLIHGKTIEACLLFILIELRHISIKLAK